MVISQKTREVIKNFHGINGGLVFRKGKVQRTMSKDQDILAEVILDIEIPAELGIYNLQTFIGNIDNLDNPEIDFDKNAVILLDKDTNVRYYTCKPSMVLSPNENVNLSTESPAVEFLLPQQTLTKALKIAATNQSDRIEFARKNGVIQINLKNSKDREANSATVKVLDQKGSDETITFEVALISKLIGANYRVQLDTKNDCIGVFIADDYDLKYYVAEALTGSAK